MEPFGIGAFVIGGVALVGVAMVAGKIARHIATNGPAVSWRALAEDRSELSFRDVGSMGFMDPVLKGKAEGITLEIDIWDEPQGKTSRRVTRYRAKLQRVLPARLRLQVEGVGWKLLQGLGLKDIEVGDRDIDSALRITSSDPAATLEVMDDHAVREALGEVIRADLRVQLDGHKLQLLQIGVADREIGVRFKQFLALSKALDNALTHPWKALAALHGLTIRRGSERVRVQGSFDGLDLTALAGHGSGGEPPHTTIRVRVPGDLPRGLWITRRDENAPEGCLDLPDPVLGHMLCVRAQRPEVVTELLDDDELRTLLLEVVHGHPGSAVQTDTVVLEIDGFVGKEIGDKVELAAGLARALGERCPSPTT